MKMHTDISKRCTNCGKEVWPQLATAVIVLVRRGDEVLLVHARNFRGDFFGLVAGLMVGFRADYVSGDIHLQRSELSKGAWFHRDNLPQIPEKLSIARKLIDSWLDEKK